MVDYTIENEQLADWIRKELELPELADELNRLLEQNATVEQFVMAILTYSSIYTSGDLSRIQDVLDRLKNQKPVEKQKYKADSLLESGSVKSAIMVYREILYGERDESMEGTFYGKVYACLGAAYGRLFLYREAAKMYEAAYQICEDKDMLRAYLYASRNCMSGEEYMQLLQKSQLFQEVDSEIAKTAGEVADSVTVLQYEDTLEHWKNLYRRISTGEI